MDISNNEAMPIKKDGKWFLAVKINNKVMYRKPTKNAIKRAERQNRDITEYNGDIFPNIAHQHKPLHIPRIDGIDIDRGKASHPNHAEWKDRFSLFEVEKVLFTKRGKSSLMDNTHAVKHSNKDFEILSKIFLLQFSKYNKITFTKREPKTEINQI